MDAIEIGERALADLPNNDVSAEMLNATDDVHNGRKPSTDTNGLNSTTDFGQTTGGPCLERTNEDVNDAICCFPLQ